MVISAGSVYIYREGVIRQLESAQRDRFKRIAALRSEIDMLESQDLAEMQVLLRARGLQVDKEDCPRCALLLGKKVGLVAVSAPEGADDEVDYYRCADACGYDNLP